jgi:hypothetical protein|tara:strand:- start:632 stop:1126 length:495 start_codon:yes stop_codon:yes gene_type:complete
MKHLLNDMSQDEMNTIRGQHTGGKKITVENFSNMVNKKLGEVPTLLSESESTIVGTQGFEIEEQGIGSKLRAAVSGNKEGRDQRKKERKEKRSRIDDERARGRVISYNDDLVNRINKFVRSLESDEDISDNFGRYIQGLRDMSNTLKGDTKNTLKSMELGVKEK